MKFDPPLIQGTILKRYKRFLADIRLDDGQELVCHVPNTGSMTGCWEPNWRCYLSQHDNPKRKLKYTLEMTDNGESLIGVNTARTNHLVEEALKAGTIEELRGFTELKREVKAGESRLDFGLDLTTHPHYIEVKNVTLKSGSKAIFPDAVSIRGQKHLKELIRLKKDEKAATTMLYIIQRQDTLSFSPADDIDPEYGSLLRQAHASGVKVLAYECELTPTEIKVQGKVKVEL